jgi:hypothetical protein
MTRALLIPLALLLITPVAVAQPLPPPRNPAGDTSAPADDLILRRVDQSQGPAIVPPQNVPQQPVQNVPQQPAPIPPQAGQAGNKNPDPMRELILARLKAEKERQQAKLDRMNQAKAARAAEEQKLYEDWHQRYLADTPVRVEYYRALAAAYQSQPAVPYYTPYFYGPNPPLIYPVVYAPVVVAPIYRPVSYGIVYSWGW